VGGLFRPNRCLAERQHPWIMIAADAAGTRIVMVKPPNYGQERAQRSRAQQSRKQEKLQRREEESQKRKAAREAQSPSDSAPNENK